MGYKLVQTILELYIKIAIFTHFKNGQFLIDFVGQSENRTKFQNDLEIAYYTKGVVPKPRISK